MSKYEAGVVIGRFQVPVLHEVHRSILSFVSENHPKMLVFLGVAPTLGTRENPLDFITRSLMIREEFPNATILPLMDHPSDEVWSQNLDQAIRTVFPLESVVLYGGRDSFRDSYKGQFDTKQMLPGMIPITAVSGTEIRQEVAMQPPIASEAFRRGVIYACMRQYPRAFGTVDVAVYRTRWVYAGQTETEQKFAGQVQEVLLGRKKDHGGLCFPGGFVSPNDGSLEEAVVRELHEETHLEVGGARALHYIGSYRVDDWRYTKTDRIITTLFAAQYVFGREQAGDDLPRVEWHPVDYDTANAMVSYHRPLFLDLMAWLEAGRTRAVVSLPESSVERRPEDTLLDAVFGPPLSNPAGKEESLEERL